MKILFISPHYLWGGASIANITIAKLLQENGNVVVYNDEYFKYDEYNGVPINHLKFHSNKKEWKTKFLDYIQKNAYDVIIWEPAMAIFYYSLIKKIRKAGIKQLSIVHSLSLNKNLKSWLVDNLTSWALSKMDSIVYVSNYTKDSWNKFPFIRSSKANQYVIYNSVFIPKPSEVHSSILGGKVKIGFVGRFSSEKQPDIFGLLSICQKYELHAWGDGPLFSYMQKKFPLIHYHGLETDITLIYSAFDILVMTSKFENCPMVILEAKSRGIPCVAPRVGGIPEIITDYKEGRLFNNYNVPEIIDCIETIADNYHFYSQNCIEKASRFTSFSTYCKWKEIL